MFDYLVFTASDAKRVVDALFGKEEIDWDKVLEEVQK